jgi:hypothetical protein
MSEGNETEEQGEKQQFPQHFALRQVFTAHDHAMAGIGA